MSDWEEKFSQDWEPWEEDDQRRARAKVAAELVSTDATAALARFIALTDEGSVFAIRWVGTLYRGGHGIEANNELAEEYFRRGISAGSWMATLSCSKLLYDRGAHDEWPAILADGVSKGFVPSLFWQAWYTYRLNPSRKAAEAVRPLMLGAAEAGHPGAKLMLARWTARGRYGWRKIPQGFGMLQRVVADRSVSPGTA